LLQWKSNKYYLFWVCVCSLRYPACNAHTPYCHLLPVWLYNIFRHYLTNRNIFREENCYGKQKACFDSLHNFCLNFFFIITRIQRYVIKYLRMSAYKVLVILARF